MYGEPTDIKGVLVWPMIRIDSGPDEENETYFGYGDFVIENKLKFPEGFSDGLYEYYFLLVRTRFFGTGGDIRSETSVHGGEPEDFKLVLSHYHKRNDLYLGHYFHQNRIGILIAEYNSQIHHKQLKLF